MKPLLLAVQSLVLVLFASAAGAQPIPRPVPDSVRAYFEQACSAELGAMNAIIASGNGGIAHEYYYESISGMTEAAIRQRFREYDGQVSGFLPRRADSAFYQASIVWEDCLMNARLRQLGVSTVPRPALPPPPPPPNNQTGNPNNDQPSPANNGEDAILLSDGNGRERWVMRNGGRDCVVVQSGQQRGAQSGMYEQTVTLKNRCNVAITVSVCAPDGGCRDFNAPANDTTTQIVGTSQGLVKDFRLIKLEDLDPDFPVLTGGDDEGGNNPGPAPVDNSPIDFGDDSGPWAGDGECDDPRFSGPAMADAGTLTEDNYFRDATDCRNAINNGSAEFVGYVDLDRDEGGDFDAGSFWRGVLDTINTGLDVYNTLHDNGGGDYEEGDSGDYDGGFDDDEEDDSCVCSGGICTCQ